MPPPAFRRDPYGPYADEIAWVNHRLNPNERLFLAEFCVDRDERRAAAAMGLHPGKGKAFLRRDMVVKALDLIDRDRRERHHVTADKLTEEYAKIGFANMGDYLDAAKRGDHYFEDLDRDQRAALAEVTIEEYMDGRGESARDVKKVKFKLHDKKGSLDSLGRHLGIFIDRVEVKNEMAIKLANMTREERHQLMYALLERVGHLLPAGETIDMEPAEDE